MYKSREDIRELIDRRPRFTIHDTAEENESLSALATQMREMSGWIADALELILTEVGDRTRIVNQ